mgnify:CR=1 FL=1
MIGIVYFFQQLFGERQYLVEGMQFMRSGDAARDLAEVVEFDFQRQCIAGKAVALETFHQFGGHMVSSMMADEGVEISFSNVMFTPHGFSDAYSFYGAQVYSPGKVVIKLSGFTELACQHFKGTGL